MSGGLIVICSLISVGTFVFWEFVAWLTHKYVMHGFLWSWHRSHHTVHQEKLERNDFFALVFSVPSIFIFYYFSIADYNPYMLAVGLGILLYGIFYFLFHDLIVHQRIRWRPSKPSRYLRRMIHAHYVHHSSHTKENCEAFGFLYAPRKYEPLNFALRKDRKETQ